MVERSVLVRPECGLEVCYGSGAMARLSQLLLPPLVARGWRVLLLDGANCADPRVLERFARERNLPYRALSRQVHVSRAFTCFQLAALIARAPRWLDRLAAQAVIITALPELFYDEDVRDFDARVSFERALRDLRRLCQRSAVAVFSGAPLFAPRPARRLFLKKLTGVARSVWRAEPDGAGQLKIASERSLPA